MNKLRTAFSSTQTFGDFVDRMASKWRLKIQETPPKPRYGETPEEILRDLIAMPTVTGNTEALHNGLNYIDEFLTSRGLFVTRHEWNGVESLIATTRRTKTPTVFLTGHLDVVPGDPSMFELTQDAENYYGRGVIDMKSAIAAYLSVIKDLPGNMSDYDFGVMIMTDEEAGGFDGAINLAAEGYRANIMILPDGGLGGWQSMERLAKGVWHVTLEATGASAHGSRPWEGENAIDKLMAVIPQIRALFPDVQDPETSTISVGIIQGGEAINQIPAAASASIDMRFASVEDQQHIQEQVMRIATEQGLTLRLEVEGDLVIQDPNDTYLKAYAECTETIIGKPIEWAVSNAANDGRHFKGATCAVAYPEGGNHHGPGEWMKKEGYTQLQQIIRMYLDKVAYKKP